MSKKSIIRSSFNLINYDKNSIDKYFYNNDNNNDLLLYYLNSIKNFEVLNDEMINNIKNFDEDSKMKIIVEYNNLIELLINSNILCKKS